MWAYDTRTDAFTRWKGHRHYHGVVSKEIIRSGDLVLDRGSGLLKQTNIGARVWIGNLAITENCQAVQPTRTLPEPFERLCVVSVDPKTVTAVSESVGERIEVEQP